MSAQPAPFPDFVTLVILVSATVLDPELSRIVGPYAVIFFSAALGGAWGASRQETYTRIDTLKFLLLGIGTALVITVPLSVYLEQHWLVESKWTLGPVAMLVGGIGKDWPRVGEWVLGFARKVIELWAKEKGVNK